MSQTITVIVPPTVRVETVGNAAVSVITNAGRAPAPGDQVYRLGADGNYAPADDALVARVMSARWADGSWCSTTAVHRGVSSDGGHESDDGEGHDDEGQDR